MTGVEWSPAGQLPGTGISLAKNVTIRWSARGLVLTVMLVLLPTFHLLSYCNPLGNCRAALLVTLAEQAACKPTALLRTRSVLHQLSCCRQDASLLCRPGSYRDIRHDERPRLCRGHSSCRMSHPFIPLGAPVSPCLGRLLHRLTRSAIQS